MRCCHLSVYFLVQSVISVLHCCLHSIGELLFLCLYLSKYYVNCIWLDEVHNEHLSQNWIYIWTGTQQWKIAQWSDSLSGEEWGKNKALQIKEGECSSGVWTRCLCWSWRENCCKIFCGQKWQRSLTSNLFRNISGNVNSWTGFSTVLAERSSCDWVTEAASLLTFYCSLSVAAGAQRGHITWKFLELDIISIKGALTAELLMPKEITQNYLAVMQNQLKHLMLAGWWWDRCRFFCLAYAYASLHRCHMLNFPVPEESWQPHFLTAEALSVCGVLFLLQKMEHGWIKMQARACHCRNTHCWISSLLNSFLAESNCSRLTCWPGPASVISFFATWVPHGGEGHSLSWLHQSAEQMGLLCRTSGHLRFHLFYRDEWWRGARCALPLY